MPNTCPCCGSSKIRISKERTQSNGIRMGGGRCWSCDFVWSTVNGQLSKPSRHSIEKHLAKTGVGFYGYGPRGLGGDAENSSEEA